MAMAYWGISMSAAGDYRPAFQLLRDPYDGGRAGTPMRTAGPDAVQRTTNGAAVDGRDPRARGDRQGHVAARQGDARERLYIEAEAARREPDVEECLTPITSRRCASWSAAYPDDLEAKSILGLALLDGYDSVTKEPRDEHDGERLRLLEEVVAKDDNHFGAHHYLIHGWEGSKTPEKAWRACKRYPELVTNIPHALHMPGHIYAQSDKIDEAIGAFARAAANELAWLERRRRCIRTGITGTTCTSWCIR